MKLTAALFTCLSTISLAQVPQVPHKMQFAGMTLTIRDDARREIQKDVDLLTQSPKHMGVKVERAKTYFPIIEKIFEEERVPDDFKYLVLQESALISDAVSVSNAVGFWQFKDFTAIEMGMRVDKEVDERMNIVSSSRGAARYIKKNNYYFNNWLYALQAYQMGAGGVMKAVKNYESGAKHMEITSQTYWYVKKFLAHKIAFENAIVGTGNTKILTVVNRTRKSMTELANEFAVEEDELRLYNTWVRNNHIPDDKPYIVAIPTIGENKMRQDMVAKANVSATRAEIKPGTVKTEIIELNGIPATQVHSGETATMVATRTEVDLAYFLKCNDISISDKLMTDKYYYLKKKRAKGSVSQHVVQKGDDWWSISQRYGVQLKKLLKYNRASAENKIPEGTIVFLSGKKPTQQAQTLEVAGVDSSETFNWGVELPSSQPVPVLTASTVFKKEEAPVDSISREEMVSVQPVQHTVSAGETLYSIAGRYQVGVTEIAQWNKLNLADGIKPGQVLKIQAPAIVQAPATREITHVVKTSDTLYGIARQYGVTIKELMDWNQKKDFTLTVGENLKILQKP